MGDTKVVPKRGTRVPRRVLAVVPALLAVVLAAACAGSTSSSGVARGAPEKADRHGTQAQPNQPSQPGQPNQAKAPPPENRSIVYTAEMAVRVKAVDAAVTRAKGIAIGAGGYVADENTNEASANGSQDVSTLVLRIPVDKYQPTLDRLGRELGRRLSVHQTSQDKTTEVQDVNSRVASAQTSLRRLRKIMDKATTVSDIMRVEGEISSRESDLESLQAQAKALSRQTSYSTVTLNVLGPRVVVHHKTPPPPGFADGLAAGWHALVAFLRVTVLVVGAVLPFLLPIAVVGVPVWWYVRRRTRAGTPPPRGPEPTPSE